MIVAGMFTAHILSFFYFRLVWYLIHRFTLTQAGSLTVHRNGLSGTASASDQWDQYRLAVIASEDQLFPGS